ncbi:MAG: cation:proton antiporter [Actinomycetota bacterium]|nr:cation:proton antiporter [Actinomycetota bacterium]
MESSEVLVELGAVIVGLAILSRLATRIGIPTIPLYLTAGLAFGEGGLVPLVITEDFVEVGAEIGLILLLFMLGLEYSASELLSTIRGLAPIGVLDLALNFAPGFAVGLLVGLGFVPAVVLGGVTYVSSSGIVAKLLGDLGRIGNRETPLILSILVTEDLAMALYLPMVGALLTGGGGVAGILPGLAAVAAVILVLAAAAHIEVGVSRLVFSRSDEALLLSILGITLLIAGAAESIRVSAAVAALLVGIVLSGPPAEGAQTLLAPLRDLFAAMFFAFVGLSIDPSAIPPVLAAAGVLAVLGVATKLATGWVGAKRMGVGPRGRVRAGAALVARGEFSIAIAGLATAAGVDPGVEALAVSYVFLLAITGPVLARVADPVAGSLFRRSRKEREPRAVG